FISKKVDGITTWTLNSGAADSAYKEAFDNDIPVIGYNSTSDYFTTVIKQETDSSCVPAEDAAEYISENKLNAKVLVVGGPPVYSSILRVDCFLEAAEKQDLEILQQQDNVEDAAASAQTLVENMLNSNPEADVIWAFNDPSALGAA